LKIYESELGNFLLRKKFLESYLASPRIQSPLLVVLLSLPVSTRPLHERTSGQKFSSAVFWNQIIDIQPGTLYVVIGPHLHVDVCDEFVLD
jgi:hypothetical protein